jgi:hypothetical protein
MTDSYLSGVLSAAFADGGQTVVRSACLASLKRAALRQHLLSQKRGKTLLL